MQTVVFNLQFYNVEASAGGRGRESPEHPVLLKTEHDNWVLK